MAKLLKLRRGSTSAHASFTGAEGEVTIDTTKDTAVVHDGSQAGGRPLAREDMTNVSSASIAGQLGTASIATTKIAGGALPTDVTVASANIVDGTIVNADVNASAAIAGTKINPSFGSQTISTSGNIVAANGTLQGGILDVGTADTSSGHINAKEAMTFNIDSDNDDTNRSFKWYKDGSSGSGAQLLALDESGTLTLGGQATLQGGAAVTGNISVTGTVDGRDVASDGSKLDGIESGATADQTAAEIRTLVESASDSNVFTDADHSKLNGIESGATADQTKSDIDALNINADTVDSLHENQFVRSDTADTASGDITFSGGAGAVTIAAGSDIRGTTGNWTGEAAGKIQWHSNHMYFQTNSNWIFRSQNGTERAYLDSSGNIVATGNVTAYSDARLKTDISTINDALGIVGKLRGVSYKWLKDGSDGIGVIAQEIEQVLPEVVLTNVTTNPATGETTEVKSVDYGKIVGVLINAINELKAEVDELKGGK